MSRTIRITVVGGFGFLFLLSSGIALAESCEPLDAVCTAGIRTSGRVEADDPVGSVGETLDQVTITTAPVLEPIVDAVDDILGGEGIVDPPDGGGTGRVDDGLPGPSGGGTTPGFGAVGSTALVREAVSLVETVISAASGSRPTPGSPGRFDGVIEGTVRGLLVLLVLLGITVGFALVQERLDRHDPKLALAPAQAEIVRFA